MVGVAICLYTNRRYNTLHMYNTTQEKYRAFLRPLQGGLRGGHAGNTRPVIEKSVGRGVRGGRWAQTCTKNWRVNAKWAWLVFILQPNNFTDH